MNKLAIVVQRCHEDVVGGSESLAWQYSVLLRDHYQVEVLTTTAIDASTWANALPEGTEKRNGITINRFKVDQGRTPYWHALHQRLLREFEYRKYAAMSSNNQRKQIPWTLALQEEFIRKQGPYSADLISFLLKHSYDYKALIFLTYLFPTTYFGIPQCPKNRCLLVPTLHDEPPAYLSAYAVVARKVRLILWNTEAELRLGTALWGELPGRIVGMGINTQKYTPCRQKYPYLLYCGRIDLHKGCDQLIEYFLQYKKDNPSDLRLILAGKDEMGLPINPNIRYKGFVPEEEKFRLMTGATLFVTPSPYESLSIVTLEAMAQRTPVLVNGASEVLADHVLQSGGGMIYKNYAEFAEILNTLLVDQNRLSAMGTKAREYVVERCSFRYIENALIDEIEMSK
jgi:glycosyltransferase involved in cell wall biosynthesis